MKLSKKTTINFYLFLVHNFVRNINNSAVIMLQSSFEYLEEPWKKLLE